MACEQQVDFYINRPVNEVFGYLSTLPYIANIKVDNIDFLNHVIYLSKGASILSWGENITISFYDPMNGGARLIVLSKPKLPTTLIDYGSNKSNVTTIHQFITSLYGY